MTEKEKIHKTFFNPWKTALMLVTLLLVLGVTYSYTQYISPMNIEKPDIQPSSFELEPGMPVEEEHVQYLVNELGAYKLHDDPLTKEPSIIEVRVTDVETYFTIVIVDNYPEVADGKAKNPDIRLHAENAVFIELLQKEDFLTEVMDYSAKGIIWVEPLVDEATLAIKGYKGIYDTIRAACN